MESKERSPAIDVQSYLRDDGWMVNLAGDLLFWVPPWHREGLWMPSNDLIIGEKQTRLDLSRFVHREDWVLCAGNDS